MLLTAEQVLEGAPQATVLTIDFFDTLITRSVAQPTHVFALMEQQLVKEHGATWNGFAVRRVQAERDARMVAASDDVMRDVTIDEIYLAFAQSHGMNMGERTMLIALEKLCELQCVQPVAFGVAVTLAARARGMRVVIVSDNYMPTSHIVNMAHGAGYSWATADDVFVSCEHGGMKHNGELWNTLISSLNLDVASVLHVGDDEVADDVMPRSFGITTHVRTTMRRSHRNMANTSPAILPLSRIESMYRDKYANEVWPTKEVLGGGAIALLVTAQIVDVLDVLKSRSVAGVHFVARDGYLAHQVWEKLRENGVDLPPSTYAVLSRSVIWRARIERMDQVVTRKLVGELESLTKERLSRRVGCDLVFADDTPEILSAEDAWSLFLSNGSRIVSASTALRERLTSYVESIGMLKAGHHLLVDLGWTGSTIADISDVVRAASNGSATVEGRLLGAYWDASPHRERVALHGFATSDFDSIEDNVRLLGCQSFFETVITAPHGSVVSYSEDAQPVLVETPCEIYAYAHVAGVIAQAAITSAFEILQGSHESGVTAEDVSREAAWAAMMQVGHTPRIDEVQLLQSISHVTSIDHEGIGEPLVACAPAVENRDHWLSEVYDHLIHSSWVQGTLTQWQTSSDSRWIADEIQRLWPVFQPQWVQVP